MKIVFDLQGAQSGSRFRGIGRYSLAFAKAVVTEAKANEVWIALSASFPETIEPLRAAFDGLIPQRQIVVWRAPGSVEQIDQANQWRIGTGELVRESFLAKLRPDLVHVSSLFEGLHDETLTSINSFETSVPTSVTLYDLIPLIHRDLHLSDRIVATWYERKLDYLRRANLWLAISDCSRRDAIERLNLPEEWVVNVGAAVDEMFRPKKMGPDEQQKLLHRYGVTRPFVMCTGVIEQRKNIESVIGAYARLPAEVRTGHQLVVAARANSNQAEMLNRSAEQEGLNPGDLVLTGFVSDEDLISLYNLCEVFVFPSWYEGFGLPALEAMSCGAATIGSNASSVPEVIGRSDALFDPGRVDDITAKLNSVLTDNSFRETLRRHALLQAKEFSWSSTARRAVEAFERFEHRKETKTVGHASKVTRPRLAYVSPLPPERSGIAGYSAELLPELARHYEIEVVVNQTSVEDSWIRKTLPLRDWQWFDQNSARYDRVLYHFGNSTYHRHMFELLERHPGIVVLHDFFLGNVIAHMDGAGISPGAWNAALYISHGYGALKERVEAADPTAVAWKYPVNMPVLRRAEGVIVHSEFARELADHWYGPGYGSDWAKIPLLRQLEDISDRPAARAQLGLGESDFLVCCFGMMGPTKLNHVLIEAWLNSSLASDRKCRLIFVGEEDHGTYGADCARAFNRKGVGKRIACTGFVSQALYRTYLKAADLAVQIRGLTRGETSAAILDCMGHGLPTVVNALGAASELPSDSVFCLPDPFSIAELTAALQELRGNPVLRKGLGALGRAYVHTHNAPRAVAEQYADAIEKFDRLGASSRVQRLAVAISRIEATSPVADADWLPLARCIAQNELSNDRGPRQWLVDISGLVRHDPKSGIQRVVRASLLQWIQEPPPGFRVEPVYCDGEGIFRYARRFSTEMLQVDSKPSDEPMSAWSGDVLLALDLFLEHIPARRAAYDDLRQRGIGLYFVVYDLLPIHRPDFFPDGLSEHFRNWLALIAQSADGALCISRTVADELLVWLGDELTTRQRPLKIGWFHLGANISAQGPVVRADATFEKILNQMGARPSVLMVGTIEPRKGHAQALAAFDTLWESGLQANLVIVGRLGWLRDPPVIKQLRAHPELGRRLFWLDAASDAELLHLYQSVSGVLVASEGEGYGLPLIEAAQHGLPILARDLPVFREVVGDRATYFSGDSSPPLASALEAWLTSVVQGTAPDSSHARYLTWKESAQRLAHIILQDDWYADWASPSRTAGSGSGLVGEGPAGAVPLAADATSLPVPY